MNFKIIIDTYTSVNIMEISKSTFQLFTFFSNVEWEMQIGL